MQDAAEGCPTRSGSLTEPDTTGRLDDEGYTGSIQNGVMKFSKGSLIVAQARKFNTQYLMNARLCPEEVNVVMKIFGNSVKIAWNEGNREDAIYTRMKGVMVICVC